MRKVSRTLLLSTALLTAALLPTAIMMESSPAFAQAAPAPQDVELEGEIMGFRKLNGINQMNVMGVWVNVPTGAAITSASGELTIGQLIDETAIPGFDGSKGFIGGTGIVTGTSDDLGNVTAETVFADTAENVLLGTVRENVNIGTDKSFNVEGTKVLLLPSSPTANSYPTYPKSSWKLGPDGVTLVHPLYDARYKGKPLMNAYGFRIQPASIPKGTLVAAEGYFSKKEGKFLAFSIEADAGELVNADTPAVSIQRAQCRQRDGNTIDLEVRGAIYNPGVTPPAGATGNVNIFKPALNGVPRADYGTQAAVADVDRFGIYDYDARITTTQGCPPKVRAQYFVNGTPHLAPATEVEIRID